MFSLHTLSLHYKAPPFLWPSIFLRNKPKTLINSQLLSHRLNYVHFEKRKAHPPLSSASRVVCSVEKESEQYEVDPDKAREALKNLDQQIQSLSQKQTRSSKLKGNIIYYIISHLDLIKHVYIQILIINIFCKLIIKIH